MTCLDKITFHWTAGTSFPCAEDIKHYHFIIDSNGILYKRKIGLKPILWPVGEAVNTLPSQGNIHGFKSHTGHHYDRKLELLKGSFFIIKCIKILIF